MMSRSFSKREKVMLIVLVVMILAALYYFIFLSPLLDNISAANTETQSIQDETMIETVKLGQMKDMQAAIEAAEAEGSATSSVPAYDNLENVMRQLNVILASTSEYDLSFGTLEISGSTVNRPIEATFTCANYEAAQSVINRIYENPYKCVIDSIGISSESREAGNIVTDNVSVEMSIFFVEQIQ